MPIDPSALDGIERKALETIELHGLADGETAVLLMVSGGSDSTALAYVCESLHRKGKLGLCGIVHVNHHLRGGESDGDAEFVSALAHLLGMPFYSYDVNVADEAHKSGKNVEAVGRQQRYLAAHEALEQLCLRAGCPVRDGRIFTAHTVDDRIENFYMRSIVGTGPGGFRAMRYRNNAIARPLLDIGREELRDYIRERARRAEEKGEKAREHDAARSESARVVRDEGGALWREDATNAHTDRFRAYVRHRMVPVAKEWNPRFAETLARTMNLIADEDDYLTAEAARLAHETLVAVGEPSGSEESAHRTQGEDALQGQSEHEERQTQNGIERKDENLRGENDRAASESLGDFGMSGVTQKGFRLLPAFGKAPQPLQKRVVFRALQSMIGPDARVETASIDAVLGAFDDKGMPQGGYVKNIQSNIAVSANKRGVLVEPMEDFRVRRKRADGDRPSS